MKEAVFIVIPILYLIGYMVVFYVKFPIKLDILVMKRLHYLLSTLWLIVFLIVFYKNFNLIIIKDVLCFSSKFANLSFIIIIWVIVVMFYDYVFISCKSIHNIKIKDVELTVEELEQIKYFDNQDLVIIENLYGVLESRRSIIKYIDSIASGENEVDIETEYINVLKKYAIERGNISIDAFYEDNKINQYISDFTEFSDQQISSILYSVNYCSFCVPDTNKKDKYLVARLKTIYGNADIIVIIKGEYIIDKEHIILIDIINYLEVKITLALAKNNLK